MIPGPEAAAALKDLDLFQDAPRPRSRESVADDGWPEIELAAYHGLAGEAVMAIGPETESDPIAILLHLLAFFGNAVGRGPHYIVESTRHGTNLFPLLVGRSSKARKGTAADRVRALMDEADRVWASGRIRGGLSSGEGLVTPVRDGAGDDPGVADKRLMILETEFVNALVVMKREGNTLSRLIRDAWDRGDLEILTKKPQHATGALISIIGHITADELRRELDRTSMANGFANRFLFACVKRARLLPHGGSLDFDVLRQHESAEVIGAALDRLVECGKAVSRRKQTGGRPTEIWIAK